MQAPTHEAVKQQALVTNFLPPISVSNCHRRRYPRSFCLGMGLIASKRASRHWILQYSRLRSGSSEQKKDLQWEKLKDEYISLYRTFAYARWSEFSEKMDNKDLQRRLSLKPEHLEEWEKVRKLREWGDGHSERSGRPDYRYKPYHQLLIAIARNLIANGVCTDTPRKFRA